MCEFVSWIQKGEQIFFLTDEDLAGKPGKELEKYCGCKDDLLGHGAIRRYYNFNEGVGTNHECTDFTTPDNYPTEIVAAIKDGNMTGFRACPVSLSLLTRPAREKYDAVKRSAFWGLFSDPKNRAREWTDEGNLEGSE